MAMYITPENIASIVSARARGESGTMSLSPTPDSVLKLRNSSSIHVRGCGGTDTSLKLPGTQACQAEQAYANAHPNRVGPDERRVGKEWVRTCIDRGAAVQ